MQEQDAWNTAYTNCWDAQFFFCAASATIAGQHYAYCYDQPFEDGHIADPLVARNWQALTKQSPDWSVLQQPQPHSSQLQSHVRASFLVVAL